ncbi:MAG: transposase [Proteobacteria bacterium]|nr:transposase [Pseudomonadota bacterium]
MGDQKYRIDVNSLNYLKTHKLPVMPRNLLNKHPGEWRGLSDWEKYLDGLYWIHAERKINELIPLNERPTKDTAHVRSLFWGVYALFKKYKLTPDEISLKDEIEQKFDALCSTKTCYQLLNNVLKRLKKNKAELLLVLTYPELPLHNNLSEVDIREYVKKRKISGGTRSDHGKQCRDTFASLKKRV